MSDWRARTPLGVLAAIVVALTGCIDYQGMHHVRDDGPSTAEFRNEAEFIPNAVLVREDTSPKWQLGRYAFKRGADRLLVISRITSFAEKESGSRSRNRRNTNANSTPKRYDQILERVWISLELGVETGKRLDLDMLQQKFRVGYDEGPIDGEMYVQPNRVIGQLTLVEEGPNIVVIDISMRVKPIRLPAWEYSGVISVPVTPAGVRAKAVQPQEWARRMSAKQKEAENAAAKEAQKRAADEAPKTTPPPQEPMPGEAPAVTQPAEQTGQDIELEKILLNHKWIGDDGGIEYRFQFDADGKFTYSTSSTGNPPTLKWGKYTVKRDHVVLSVAYAGNGSAGPEEQPANTTEIVRCQPQSDDSLLLEMVHPEGHTFHGEGGGTIFVTPTSFEDMRLVPPPARR